MKANMETNRRHRLLELLCISFLASYVLLRVGVYVQPSLASPALLLVPLSLSSLCTLLLLSSSSRTS